MSERNVWLVVASERIKGKTEGWHWDDFFMRRHEWSPAEFSWGGYEWIRSPLSLKFIREMKRGDIVVAYQAGEGILGLCALSSGGYEEVPGTGDINTFDLAPEPALRLDKPVPLSQLKNDPQTSPLFRQLQGSVFKATEFWEGLKRQIISVNPHLADAIKLFERKVEKLRQTLDEEKDVWRKMAEERAATYLWRGRTYKRKGEQSAWLRKLYDFRCQICGAQFPTPDGRMVIEVHYLRPLKIIGPVGDHPGNMLILCPNHHLQIELSEEVRVDWEEKTIRFDGTKRRLRIHPTHAHLAMLWMRERKP
ncbi:MAG: hypothetical protein ACK40X_05610 [Armatimonadota bacterium]